MPFAPPALIHAVMRSPALMALPMATQRAIMNAASPEAGAVPGSFGANADVAAGPYRVSESGVPLRATPSAQSHALGTLEGGEIVTAIGGASVNYFSRVHAPGLGEGWIGTHYLMPLTASGPAPGVTTATTSTAATDPLALTPAEELQLRAVLVAWDAAIGHTGYGGQAVLDDTPIATLAQQNEVTAFQTWWNGAGHAPTLRTDGVVDPTTRGAILEWTQQAIVGGPNPNQPPPAQDPNAPPPGNYQQPAPAAPSNNGPLVLLAGAAIMAFILVEQKKKKKRKKAA